MESHSIYIHIPFCLQRCRYCDFNTYAGMQSYLPEYVSALKREVEQVARSLKDPLPVHTVYFGGGTPSLLDVASIQNLLDRLRETFMLRDDVEITMEANPGTVTAERLVGFNRAGVNRLSLGIQSIHPEELELLGRCHSTQQATLAYEAARKAGFNNINLDLIYGLPGQDQVHWKASLMHVIQWKPEHLSLYALTLDDDVPLAQAIRGGELPGLDDDQAADHYELATDLLTAAGFEQYEISNWAANRNGKPHVCRHNLQYWHNQPYLGLGAGAHGYAGSYRTVNTHSIPEYIDRMHIHADLPFPFTSANVEQTLVSEAEKRSDALMLGLRLTKEGIARSHYIEQYQLDFYHQFGKVIDQMVCDGLLEWLETEKQTLRLTRRGRLLGNQVFMHFVGER